MGKIQEVLIKNIVNIKCEKCHWHNTNKCINCCNYGNKRCLFKLSDEYALDVETKIIEAIDVDEIVNCSTCLNRYNPRECEPCSICKLFSEYIKDYMKI